MRTAAVLMLLSACHATRYPQKIAVSDCGEEIPGFDAIAHRPVVLLGEMHGMVGPPEFAVDLACRLARQKETVLALEISHDEQGRIDTYLASEGRAADRAQLLASVFWTRPIQDGRSSQARFEMFEHARRLIHAGHRLRVVAVDGGPDREKVMAAALVALAQRGPVVMLVGNSHARTTLDPEEHGERRMGVMVHEQIPRSLSLDSRYGAGDAWIYTGPPLHCGRERLDANDPGTRWTIRLFAKPDDAGMDGTYDVGPAHASDPAVR